MPIFAAFMVLFGMANSGLPATSGFVGEFLVILASFRADFWYAFLAGLTLILGAAYTLWLVKRVVFGPVANHHVAELTDVNGRELLVLGVLALRGARSGPVAGAAAGRDAPDGREPGAADHRVQALKLSSISDGSSSNKLWYAGRGGRDLPADGDLRDPADRCVPGRQQALAHLRTHDADAGGLRVRHRGLRGRRAASPRSTACSSPTRWATCSSCSPTERSAVSLLYSREYLQRNGLFRGEFFILALVALLGVMVMISAGSLLTVYLGVELLALSLYALVAFDRDSGIAAESAMKYFVLGAIASGTLLYGFSILYGIDRHVAAR